MFHVILLPVTVYAIFAFIRLNFLTLRTFNTKFDSGTNRCVPQTAHSADLVTFFLSATAAMTLVPLITSGSAGPFATAIQLQAGLLLSALVLRLIKSGQGNFTPVAVLFTLLSCLLLLANNLLQVYILIEIAAYLNLLFLAAYGLHASAQRSHQNIAAMLISFILNFISSLLLYMYCLGWGYDVGDLTAQYWVFETSRIACVGTAFLIIKLGTGP